MVNWLFVGACALLMTLQFVTVCAMTRCERGKLVTALAFGAYAVLHVAYLVWVTVRPIPFPLSMQAGTPILWVPLASAIVHLSRDRDRALFLALDYGAYSAIFLPLCHASIQCLGGALGYLLAYAVILAFHALFLFVLLPLVPESVPGIRWRGPCLAAATFFVGLYFCGVWPHSLALGGPIEYLGFAVMAASSFFFFVQMLAGLRAMATKLRMVRSLSLLTAEMQVRRAFLDAARRQRHDERHHRIALSEMLLRGQVDKALAYLEKLDAEADENPTAHLVWCENETVNAILSGYQRKAEKKGVAFEATANVSAAVDLPDTDVVAVLANLIENALHATAAPGTVSVTVRERTSSLGFTVANPVPDAFALSPQGLPCARPGIGMRSVQRAVARHGGELAYAIEGGRLVCRAMLKTQGGAA